MYHRIIRYAIFTFLNQKRALRVLLYYFHVNVSTFLYTRNPEYRIVPYVTNNQKSGNLIWYDKRAEN